MTRIQITAGAAALAASAVMAGQAQAQIRHDWCIKVVNECRCKIVDPIHGTDKVVVFNGTERVVIEVSKLKLCKWKGPCEKIVRICDPALLNFKGMERLGERPVGPLGPRGPFGGQPRLARQAVAGRGRLRVAAREVGAEIKRLPTQQTGAPARKGV